MLAARVLAEGYWRRGCSPDGDADNEAVGAGNELAHCPPCFHGVASPESGQPPKILGKQVPPKLMF